MSITEEIAFDKDGQIEKSPIYKRLYLALIIILVASLAFGLGRLSKEGRREGIQFEYDPEFSSIKAVNGSMENQSASALNSIKSSAENVYKALEVVASSKGSKYHYPNCPGAKQISEKNKITFVSAQAAEASGYTLASNCKAQ